jgi:hypothetical protein
MRKPLRSRRRRPMILHKIILVFFVSFISIYPLCIGAQVPPPYETQRAITMEEARQFIDEYSTRFMKLELDPFIGLFSEKAVENRVLPYADIRRAYQKTIAGSRSIMYHLKIYTIQTSLQSALVRGRYEIVQKFKKGGVATLRGDIQWDLIREGDVLKIRGVDYGRDR